MSFFEKHFPDTVRAWRRGRLLRAERLVMSTFRDRRCHSYDYIEHVFDAANAVRDFREMYYPAKPSPSMANERGNK